MKYHNPSSSQTGRERYPSDQSHEGGYAAYANEAQTYSSEQNTDYSADHNASGHDYSGQYQQQHHQQMPHDQSAYSQSAYDQQSYDAYYAQAQNAHYTQPQSQGWSDQNNANWGNQNSADWAQQSQTADWSQQPHTADWSQQSQAPDWSQQSQAPNWSQWRLGEWLRSYRNYYGYNLYYCSEELRIRVAYLDALEKGAYKELPGVVHTKGFVRSYAQFLQLPVDEMLALYKSEVAHDNPQIAAAPHVVSTVMAHGGREQDLRAPRGLSLLLCLVVVVFGFAGWAFFSQSNKPSVQLLASTQELEQREEQLAIGTGDDNADYPALQTQSGLSVPSEMLMNNPALFNGAKDLEDTARFGPTVMNLVSAAPSDLQTEIKIRALELTWIVIKDRDGNDLASEVLETGAEYIVPDMNNLKLSVADLDSIEVSIDNQAVAELRSLDSNGLYYSLEPADLRAGLIR